MRYELSDCEWSVIKPMLPNKPRGIPRVDDRRVLNGIFWALRSARRGVICPKSTAPAQPATTALSAGGGPASGTKSWRRWPPLMMRRCG